MRFCRLRLRPASVSAAALSLARSDPAGGASPGSADGSAVRRRTCVSMMSPNQPGVGSSAVAWKTRVSVHVFQRLLTDYSGWENISWSLHV